MDEREREQRKRPRAVESTRSHYVLVKPCCGEPVRLERAGLDLSAAHQVSCPDCPLALFAPFLWMVTLRREPGGALTAEWGLRATLPRVWSRDGSGSASDGVDGGVADGGGGVGWRAPSGRRAAGAPQAERRRPARQRRPGDPAARGSRAAAR